MIPYRHAPFIGRFGNDAHSHGISTNGSVIIEIILCRVDIIGLDRIVMNLGLTDGFVHLSFIDSIALVYTILHVFDLYSVAVIILQIHIFIFTSGIGHGIATAAAGVGIDNLGI